MQIGECPVRQYSLFVGVVCRLGKVRLLFHVDEVSRLQALEMTNRDKTQIDQTSKGYLEIES